MKQTALKVNKYRASPVTELTVVDSEQMSAGWWLSAVVSDSVTPWPVAHQAALSMGFPRQEYWSGLPCSPPGDLPDPGIKPVNPATPALQADSLPLSHWGSPHPR